jgi:rSAM/selenodomain-associated transferase 1
MSSATLVVLAKAPVAGRVKTRLSPPCTPEQAAALASAALVDTLDAVARTPADRRVIALDGEAGDWLPDGFEVVPQRGDDLDARLANVFDDVDGPTLLIGMDTPQVEPAQLREGLRALASPAVDAVLGAAEDGGFWAIGLKAPRPEAFLGVPMSRSDTCVQQRARLRALGLRTVELAGLRDVDRIADAHAVARLRPGSRFATAVGCL